MASKVIRLFVGTDPDGGDAESCAVLEYTARKNTTGPLEITWMMQSRDARSPWSGWDSRNWVTPFSGLRWGIPAACGFKGRAIYTDSDVIVLGDLRELWEKPISKPAFGLARIGEEGKGPRTCVMLFDCERARRELPSLDALRKSRDQRKLILNLLRDRPELLAEIGAGWNSLDLHGTTLEDPALRILHYSEMSTQPHLARAIVRLARSGRRHWYDGPICPHPRPEVPLLFDRLLAKAEAAGFLVGNYEPAKPFGEYAKRSLLKKPLRKFRK